MKNSQYAQPIRQTYYRQDQYKKGFASPLLLALIAILLIGGGVYVYVQNNQVNQATVVSQFSLATSSEQTSGWKTYLNEKYGFAIKYPPTWVVSSDKQAISGETSVVFSGKPDTVSMFFDADKNANIYNPGHNMTIDDVLSHSSSNFLSSYVTVDGRKSLKQYSAATGCYENTVYVPQASSTEIYLSIDHSWCIDASQSALESQSASNLEAHNSLFQLILSTFKFNP